MAVEMVAGSKRSAARRPGVVPVLVSVPFSLVRSALWVTLVASAGVSPELMGSWFLSALCVLLLLTPPHHRPVLPETLKREHARLGAQIPIIPNGGVEPDRVESI